MADDRPTIERMLRLPDVKLATGASKRTIYRWMENGHFPRGVQISPGAVAWRESDVRDWQRSRPEAGHAA